MHCWSGSSLHMPKIATEACGTKKGSTVHRDLRRFLMSGKGCPNHPGFHGDFTKLQGQLPSNRWSINPKVSGCWWLINPFRKRLLYGDPRLDMTYKKSHKPMGSLRLAPMFSKWQQFFPSNASGNVTPDDGDMICRNHAATCCHGQWYFWNCAEMLYMILIYDILESWEINGHKQMVCRHAQPDVGTDVGKISGRSQLAGTWLVKPLPSPKLR